MTNYALSQHVRVHLHPAYLVIRTGIPVTDGAPFPAGTENIVIYVYNWEVVTSENSWLRGWLVSDDALMGPAKGETSMGMRRAFHTVI